MIVNFNEDYLRDLYRSGKLPFKAYGNIILSIMNG